MKNRKRNTLITFWVDEQEKEIIDTMFNKTGIKNLSAYLRATAMCDVIVNIDLSYIDEYSQQVSAVGNNINQIAKRVNMSGNISTNQINDLEKDLETIKKMTEKMYSLFIGVDK